MPPSGIFDPTKTDEIPTAEPVGDEVKKHATLAKLFHGFVTFADALTGALSAADPIHFGWARLAKDVLDSIKGKLPNGTP